MAGCPGCVSDSKYAIRSACYFWVVNRLYAIAETGFTSEVVDRITRKINSGLFTQPPNATKTGSINGRRSHFHELNVWRGLQ